jgi:hypothetical protein
VSRLLNDILLRSSGCSETALGLITQWFRLLIILERETFWIGSVCDAPVHSTGRHLQFFYRVLQTKVKALRRGTCIVLFCPAGHSSNTRLLLAFIDPGGEAPVGSAGLCLLVLQAPHAVSKDSYLVDPASSHMLVSKIKPCMSKYKQLYTVKLRMAH